MIDINLDSLTPEAIRLWLATTGINILIILILAVVSFILLTLGTKHLSRRIKDIDDIDGSRLDKRTETISRLIRTSGFVVIVVVTLLMILSELGIDIGPILASVGIVSLALGLGAQTLVKDVIGGIFVVLEGQYHVGDVIEFDGHVGTVEDMTLRATQVRDSTGYLHIVPNGEVRIVTVRTRDWSRAIVDVGIGYDDDVDLAIETLKEIGEAATKDPVVGPLLLESPTTLGIEGLEDWQIRIRISAKTLPNEHWEVQRYFREHVREDFSKKQINLAFPRQEVVVITNE